MKDLKYLLQELENNIGQFEVLNTHVSSSSVGWHIEHVLLTTNLIIKGIERSDPEAYKAKYNFAKFYVFALNKIPRGRAKAPTAVRPTKILNEDSLREHFETTYTSLQKLDVLHKNNFFEHPYFGKINLKPARKFLCIHTNHHLKIINDILKT